MKRFTVFIEPEAELEILESYEWGVSFWGQEAAEKWIRSFYSIIFERLSLFPNGLPLAPNAEIEDREIRQMNVGRYRVLFEVRKNKVFIIHVRGPVTGEA